jgi:putative hydrolase of HD superfamily
MNLNEIKPPLRFTEGTEHIWEKLAAIPRTGWVQWEIPEPETVAEHIFSVRQLAVSWQQDLELSDADLVDVLALIEVHDWSKIGAGDRVVLGDEVDAEERYRRKKEAELMSIQKLCENIPQGSEVMRLYKRFVSQADRNAVVAKEVGLFQALLLAKEYEAKYQRKGLLAEFIHYTKDFLSISFLASKINTLDT